MQFDHQRKSNAFQLRCGSKPEILKDQAAGFHEVREWQQRAFDTLKDASLAILNAPMGSGKSFLMCLLSAYRMRMDKKLRCIIAVPQTIIASGFLDAKLKMPNGEKIHWQIKYNLCDNENNQGAVECLIRFLENSSDSFFERSIICTHSTIVAVYKKLGTENRLWLFKDILLWIDEAHHIKNVVTEGVQGAVINNSIGQLVLYFLSNTSNNLQLGLTTASFFRGDRASLLTDDMATRFKRFNLPYDEYLQAMNYLKSFRFDFLLCGQDYLKGIEQLLKVRQGKDIIYIPHPASQHSTGNKYNEVNNVIQLYGNVIGVDDKGLTLVQNKSGNVIKVIDLVNEAQRKQKKNYLDSGALKKESDSLDAIIALGMFKEGANWIYADRTIIIGARSSLVDVIQMIGRLFRDVEGKNHVEVIQVLPFSLDQKDKHGFREDLNNYLKAIFASLILENILDPVKIRAVIQKQEKKLLESEKKNEKTNWLNLALPDEAQQSALLEDVVESLADIISSNKEMTNNMHMLYEEYAKVIPEILASYGVIENTKEVAQQIWGTFQRRSMQMQGISVEGIDFNIVHEINPLGLFLRYTSGICNIDTFEKFREAIKNRITWQSFEKARNFARTLGLRTSVEWQKYVAGGMPHLSALPNDIPKAPNIVYKNNGWQGWGDWLGSGIIASQNRIFIDFEAARTFAHSLGFSSKAEWYIWAKTSARPQDIPADPQAAYAKQGWKGWGDFLGTGAVAPQHRKFRSFEESRTFARNLKLAGQQQWQEFAQTALKPKDIPTNPDKIYAKSGWMSWGDFLGTGNIAKARRKFRPFEEARVFVRSLCFKNMAEYRKWTKTPDRPHDIPAYPNETYANCGWAGGRDWLEG